MYYFIRQINPITLATLSPQMMDPTFLPSDERSTVYDAVNLNHQERSNQYQTLIGCTSLLAESGILRTRAGRVWTRRHAERRLKYYG
jgi:hypothetical protein